MALFCYEDVQTVTNASQKKKFWPQTFSKCLKITGTHWLLLYTHVGYGLDLKTEANV